MKKIAIFIYSLNGGGAEKMIIHLSNFFVSRDIHVDIITVKPGNDYVGLMSPEVGYYTLNVKKTFFALPYLIKYLCVNRPTVLLSTLKSSNFIAGLATKLSLVNTRHFARISYCVTAQLKDGCNFNLLLDALFIRIIAKCGSNFIGISEYVANDIIYNLKIPVARTHTIYNPAYDKNIQKLAKEDVDYDWFNPNYKMIITEGRLIKLKDHSTILKAFKRLLNIRVDLRLTILGSGEEKNTIENAIAKLNVKENVKIISFDPNPYKYMAKADVLVHASKFESFCNVIVEALSLNLPVVASDCPGGPKEILEGGEWGYLFPVGDFKELSSCIQKALEGTNTVNLMKRAADFDINNIGKKYLEAFMLE